MSLRSSEPGRASISSRIFLNSLFDITDLPQRQIEGEAERHIEGIAPEKVARKRAIHPLRIAWPHPSFTKQPLQALYQAFPEELLPSPFGTAFPAVYRDEVNDTWNLVSAHEQMVITVRGRTRQEVVDKWNRRK